MSTAQALKTALGQPKRRGPASKTQGQQDSSLAEQGAGKSLAEAIKNVKKSPEESPSPSGGAAMSSGRSTRSGGSRGVVEPPRLTHAQVSRLEESFLSKASPSRQERKALAANLKVQENQVQQWFQTRRSQEKDSKRDGAEANMKEITAFLNTTTPVKKIVNTTTPVKKLGGVVASAVPAREVEVVDILDDSVEEEDELSLVESPLLRSRPSGVKREEVKLTMVKSGMEEQPRTLPKLPARVVVEEEVCPQRNELVEELMARIDGLETELRAKDGALYKTKKDLDKKSGVENTLLEKEKALRSIEVSMPRMVEEHKKLLNKKDEQISALKTAKEGLETELKSSKKNFGYDQDEQKAKLTEASQQVVELKSKIQEIKLIKDDEVKSVKAELKNLTKLKDGDIKSLKTELKKAGGDKEVEIKALKEEIVKVQDKGNKVFMEEKKIELKAKDKELDLKLLAKEEELKAKLKSITEETRKKLDEKESEIKGRLTAKDKEVKQALEVKEKECNIKVIELKSKLDKSNEQVLRANAELTVMEAEVKVLKLGEAGRVDLEEKLAAAENKAEQGRREVLDLKSYQRKLEGRVGEMEEEVFMVRAELQTQGQVRAGLVARIQEKEEQLGRKKEELVELGRVNEENMKNVQSLRMEKEAAIAESQSVKRELGDASQALENMEVELEAARMNLTSPLSSQYAVNTPRRRSSNPHRLDLSGSLEEEGKDTMEGRKTVEEGRDTVEEGRDTVEEGRDTEEEEKGDPSPGKVGASSYSGNGKRPLPFPAEGEAAKRPRVSQEDLEEKEEAKKPRLNRRDFEEEVEKASISQGDMEEEEVAQLLTIDTVEEGSPESEISDEEIAKLLDKAEDVGAVVGTKGKELDDVVLAVLEDIIGKVMKEMIEKEMSEEAAVHQEILEMLQK